MSILVSGASGQIGSDLVRNLSKNFKIIAIYNTKKKIIKLKNVVWIKHNFEKKLLRKFKNRPKYIIHCAVNQKYFQNNEKKYFQSNSLIMENIIDFAKKNKSLFILNLSSIDVYGFINKNFVNEKYLPLQPNIYGKMKLKLEEKLYKENINFVNLRLPGVLSKNNQNLQRPWLNKVIKQIKQNKKINIFNQKKKFNNVIDTNEIARLFRHVIKKKIIIRDTFNFASTCPIKLNKILNLIKNRFSSRSVFYEDKNPKKNSFYISVKKIEKNLNFKTLTTQKLLTNYLKIYDNQIC